MATASLKIEINVSGDVQKTQYTTESRSFSFSTGWWPAGYSGDHYAEVYAPWGYIPVGNYRHSITYVEDCTYFVVFDSYNGNNYRFKVHIGMRGMGDAALKGTVYGDFRRNYVDREVKSMNYTLSPDKKQKDYQLLMNCEDLLGANVYNKSTVIKVLTGDTHVQYKLTNSATDALATAPGNFLWYKYSDTDVPKILNLVPADLEVLISPSVQLSADFSDGSGSGIVRDSFELWIDKAMANEIYINKDSTKTQGLMKLTEEGFIFKPVVNLDGGTHNILVRIADNHGNIGERMSSFDLNIKSFNPNLGQLPVVSLMGMGGAGASNFNNAGMITLADLVNADAVLLASAPGIGLKTATTAIERARIVCCNIRFMKGDFAELANYTIDDIISMTDEELRNIDSAQESWIQIEDIRENIGLLYICLDGPLVDNMKFGDLVWDQ